MNAQRSTFQTYAISQYQSNPVNNIKYSYCKPDYNIEMCVCVYI